MRKGRNIRPSGFICLRCGGYNDYGIDRGTHMREFLHVKDLTCYHCNNITKQVEVRFCDWREEVITYVPILREEYYKGNKSIGMVC